MAFALEIQGGLLNLAGGPADEYYQFRNPDTGVYRAYATNAEAAALVPAAARAFRTVLVAGVEKWWLPANLDDAGLVVKTGNVTPRPLYAVTGQNTDGSMTQKAVTDAVQLPQVLVRLNVVLDPSAPVVYSGASLADALDALATRGAQARFAFVDLFRQPAILERSVGVTEGVVLNGNFKILRMGGNTISHGRSARFNDFDCEFGVIANTDANPTFAECVGGRRQNVLHTAVPGSVVKMINIRYVDAPTFVRYSGGGTFILVGITPDPGPGQVANDGTVIQREGANADTLAVLPYAANLVIDFNTATVRTIAATGGIAYGPSANIAPLKTKEDYITNTTGAAITLSFPAGWSAYPGAAPTTLAAGAKLHLRVRSLGTTDSAVEAHYSTGTAGTAPPPTGGRVASDAFSPEFS